MATAPEIPFLATGAVALVGGIKREGKFPQNGLYGVVATIVLVLVASATNGTRVAPLVHAVGMLTLLGSVYGTVRTYQTKASTK